MAPCTARTTCTAPYAPGCRRPVKTARSARLAWVRCRYLPGYRTAQRAIRSQRTVTTHHALLFDCCLRRTLSRNCACLARPGGGGCRVCRRQRGVLHRLCNRQARRQGRPPAHIGEHAASARSSMRLAGCDPGAARAAAQIEQGGISAEVLGHGRRQPCRLCLFEFPCLIYALISLIHEIALLLPYGRTLRRRYTQR